MIVVRRDGEPPVNPAHRFARRPGRPAAGSAALPTAAAGPCRRVSGRQESGRYFPDGEGRTAAVVVASALIAFSRHDHRDAFPGPYGNHSAGHFSGGPDGVRGGVDDRPVLRDAGPPGAELAVGAVPGPHRRGGPRAFSPAAPFSRGPAGPRGGRPGSPSSPPGTPSCSPCRSSPATTRGPPRRRRPLVLCDPTTRGGVMAASTAMTIPAPVLPVLVQRRPACGPGRAVKD